VAALIELLSILLNI